MGTPLAPKGGGGTAPAILAHVLWPNGAWIKVPFGTGVGLRPGHVVLHEDPAPLKKGHITLQRGTYLVVNRCNEVMKDPISSTGV